MTNAVLPPLVLLHWLLPVELLVANIALKWTVISVSSLMNLQDRDFEDLVQRGIFKTTYPQIALLGVLLATDLAVEGSFSRMCHEMALHSCYTHKLFATNTTHR